MKRRKKITAAVISLFFIGVIVIVFSFLWKDIKGILPLLRHSDISPLQAVQGEGHTLVLPEGFKISIFAEEVPSARVLALDWNGNLWVSQTGQGKISMIDAGTSEVKTVLQGLKNPHGIAFDPDGPGKLYYAEETALSTITVDASGNIIRESWKIIGLPRGGRHYTRTIGIGPDNRSPVFECHLHWRHR